MRKLRAIPLAVALCITLSPLAVRAETPDRAPKVPNAPKTAVKVKEATKPGTKAQAAEGEVRTASEEFFHKLAKGGRTMIALLACSIMGGAFAIERLFKLRRKAIVPSGLAERADALWQEGKFADTLAACEAAPSTLGRVIEFIVRHRLNPVTDVAKSAGDIGTTELKRHLQRTYPLAVVATLSPLLGLLGTVFGMIEAFERVAIAGALGDATLLADGISKALITTAVGLVIAIPALAIYHYFRSRTNLFAVELEEQVTDLMSRWLMKREDDDAG